MTGTRGFETLAGWACGFEARCSMVLLFSHSPLFAQFAQVSEVAASAHGGSRATWRSWPREASGRSRAQRVVMSVVVSPLLKRRSAWLRAMLDPAMTALLAPAAAVRRRRRTSLIS